MWRFLLKVFFPSPCVDCGFLSEALCTRCFNKVEFAPHLRDLEGLQVCSAVYYEEKSIIGRLVHPFKYSHQADLFRIFVPWMKEALRLLHNFEGAVFVPVPLYKGRLLERGYNQAELLARWLARDFGTVMVPMLERCKDTGSQAKIRDRSGRIENMEGAFKMVSGCMEEYPIVLVDDIVTTGSTLLACAEVLRAAGAKKVFALTLADREKKKIGARD
jgi:ComF family protein